MPRRIAEHGRSYQASYQRANAGFQLLGDLQKQYAATRYSIVQQTVGGEIGAANTATTFGYIFGLFDHELQAKSMAFAEAARQEALRKLDEAAQSGVRVTVDGWDKGLPDPASLPPMIDCAMPASVTELVEAPAGAAR